MQCFSILLCRPVNILGADVYTPTRSYSSCLYEVAFVLMYVNR